jgi:hypothetical protein
MVSPVRLLAVIASLGLSGCGFYFPGFEGFLGLHSYIHDIPVSRITTELQCELRDFETEPKNAGILNQIQPAGISIKFQTDQSGTFQYVGINLKEVGIGGIANLIAVSNKASSLQAKIQAKTTTSSQLDLTIPQSEVELAKIDCGPDRRLFANLSLASWLDRFFDNLGRDQYNTANVCLSKITLSTQIVFILDVSAGVNPLFGPAFILPVTAETFDINPSATQNLQIALALQKYKNNLCTKIPPEPARTI